MKGRQGCIDASQEWHRTRRQVVQVYCPRSAAEENKFGQFRHGLPLGWNDLTTGVEIWTIVWNFIAQQTCKNTPCVSLTFLNDLPEGRVRQTCLAVVPDRRLTVVPDRRLTGRRPRNVSVVSD